MNMGPNSIRHFLYGISFIFVLTGIIILAHGMENICFFQQYGDLIQEQYYYISYFQIIIGACIFFVAILGWYGALAESPVFTLLFTSCLLLIFFLELAVGIGGFFLKITTHHSLTVSLQLPNSSINHEMVYRWDRLQNDFSCCGIQNTHDWLLLPNGTIPTSCCYESIHFWKEEECSEDTANLMGCFIPLQIEMTSNCVSVMILGFAIATVQLLGIAITCYLSSEFRKGYHTLY